MTMLKIAALLLVLIVTLLAGAYPFFKRLRTKSPQSFPIGESLAAGIFLGAALMHMLGDSAQGFYQLHYDYPIAFLITGSVFLLFLLLEHIGKEIYQHRGADSSAFAILAAVMLSVHSFFTGAALGLGHSTSVILMILIAILAHKWAASFALAVQINNSKLSIMSGLIIFGVFSLMAPAGIVLGSIITQSLLNYPLIEPIFGAVAAGTLLYLGTLHGLERATLIKQCCNLNRYYYVILGFGIMAVVAIWT